MSERRACACGCGGDVGPDRGSSSKARRRRRIGQREDVARYLPGHNTRRPGGYGRGLEGWMGDRRSSA